jgi:N-acetylglucosaminyldiphosphoundecaprenol N-acetyl-beta-D-mannosaminyltransferase
MAVATVDLGGFADLDRAGTDPVVTGLSRRAEVFGLPVDLLTMEASLDRAERLIATRRPHQHVVVNAAKVVKAQTDDLLRRSITDASIVNVDGQAVVWAARLLGVDVPERVAGIDFMDALLARAADRGWSVYFLGATDAVVRAVVDEEQRRHPGLIVAGARNGFWTADEEAEVVAGIAATEPTILLLAMPTPKKERFAAEHLAAFGASLVVGVGGSFDVVAGVTERAPVWMQRAGLEWFHRFAQEPRRMWKRYLVGNTQFLLLLLAELLRNRRTARPEAVFVSWIHHHGRSAGLAQALGVPAHFIAVGRRGNRWTVPWRYLVQSVRTVQLLATTRPRALYVMAPPLPLVVIGLLYRLLMRAPLVLDAHTGAVLRRSGRPKRTFVLAARLADTTVVTTEALQRIVAAAGVRSSVVLHDPPIGAAAGDGAVVGGDRPYVVMPCSWYWDEPLEVLRDAAAMTPEVDVVLTGTPTGPLADPSSWPANVRLAGFLPDAEYAALLAGATGILALTNRPLTMQRAAYEALILGRPAIVSDTTVLREYFSGGAVLVDHTPEALRLGLLACVEREADLAAEMRDLRARKQQEFAAGLDAVQRLVAA